MSYIFVTPSYVERPQTGNRLIDTFIKVSKGTTILKTSDTVTSDSYGDGYGDTYGSTTGMTGYKEVNYPTTDDIAAAKFTYLGGHEYLVSDAEAASLTAAGYGSYLTFFSGGTGYVDQYGDSY